MTPWTQENFLIEDLSQLFQNRPTKNEHTSPWPVGFSRVARIGDLKNLWHAHVLVSTKPISCKFKPWTIVSCKLDIPWAINQRVMLYVHITTRKLNKYNGKGRQTITLKFNLTLLFALKCYSIVFAPYNMTDWGTLEKNWNDTNGLEEKNNEWRIMARATAVSSYSFLSKISTFHCHCRLSCKDTCTCTCSKHIHSFWTNRIIVHWCSSQTY